MDNLEKELQPHALSDKEKRLYHFLRDFMLGQLLDKLIKELLLLLKIGSVDDSTVQVTYHLVILPDLGSPLFA